MITADWFRDKKITVMGLGLHGGGLGTSKWLLTHGAELTVTDLRDQHALAGPMADLERHYYKEARRLGKHTLHRVRYVLGRHEVNDFSGADMIIQNPGVPRESPLLVIACENQIPIETEISLFFLLCPFPVTAVTGTKGKTTTTSLLAEMCKAHDKRTIVGGNIRLSALATLDRLLALAKKRKPSPPPIVLELSSWQLESLEKHKMSPHIGVITNIKEDHLNRYRDMDDYAHAKEMNVAFQAPDDFAILNADDGRLSSLGKRIKGRVFWFSMRTAQERGCYLKGRAVRFRDGKKDALLFLRSDIRLLGEHNVGNVLAAATAARLMGVSATIIRKTVRAFKGVAGRLEEVAVKKGIRFINDTTATAPDASIAALRTLGAGKKRIVLIAGGADKNLHFEQWAAEAAAKVKHLILFDGSATPKMEKALAKIGAKVSMIGVRSMSEALREAMKHAKKGDVVLLSPGCASFGLFQHEFDRGDQFIREVRKVRNK